MDTLTKPAWLMLVISLPGRRATPRMRIWRALKGMGAAVLRDGVYLLPGSDAAHRALQEQAQEVNRSGGTAQVLNLGSVDSNQNEHFHSLFDRREDYARLIEGVRKLKSSLNGRRKISIAVRTVKRLRREYEAIRTTDHFPGAAAEQAARWLSETEAAVTALVSPGEPQAMAGDIRRLDKADYLNRAWATRARPCGAWPRSAGGFVLHRLLCTECNRGRRRAL